jgi:hypothetical protein
MARRVALTAGLLLLATAVSGEVTWCSSTAAHGSVHKAYIYEETCVPLCVEMDVTAPPSPSPPPPSPPPPSPPPSPSDVLDRSRRSLLQWTSTLNIRMTTIDEQFPALGDDAFPYPYDELNVPPTSGLFFDTANEQCATCNVTSTTLLKLPAHYCFVPNEYEECAYTVCFQGETSEGTYTGGAYLTTDVRCVKIEVMNEVLEFDGDDEYVEVDVSKKLVPEKGLTFSAWVYPTCTGQDDFNQTVMYFGSTRSFTSTATDAVDEGFLIRNGIKWHVADGQLAEEGHGQFMYHDCFMGEVKTAAQYSCDVWHYVAVTIDGRDGTLYVDGIGAGHTLPSSRDLYTFSVETFNTTTRPDFGADSTGVLKLGYFPDEGFVGKLDEVRVYNYAFTAQEVFTDMVTRTRLNTTLADGQQMKAYLTMSTMDPIQWYEGSYAPTTFPTMPTLSMGDAVVTETAIASMIPCVLGLEHTLGPVDGMCVTEVYGWSFADGTLPTCSVDGVPIRATYVSDSTVSCATPGHMSPRFATVTAANNALNFTDTFYVDKTVRHLYMESSLYLSGGVGGAEADMVCNDFTRDSQAVTVSAWSCPKCSPPAVASAAPLDIPCAHETC